MPNNEKRLKELEKKLEAEKKKNTFLSKLRIYFPITGLQVEYNKLKSWVDLYSSLMPEWMEKREYARHILKT